MIDSGQTNEGRWGRLVMLAPYLLLAGSTILILVAIWTSVQSRTLAEERYSISRSFDRATSAVRSFEQYTIRTLKAAENITRMAAVSLMYNTPKETILRARQTGVIDGVLSRV